MSASTLCPLTVEEAVARGLLRRHGLAVDVTCPACGMQFTGEEARAFDAMVGHYEARTWSLSALGVEDRHEPTPCAACGDLDDVQTSPVDKRRQAALCAACRERIADGANPDALLGGDD